MLSIGVASRIFVYRGYTDMRCGRYRLGGLVKEGLEKDPLSGDLYVFFNKRCTAIKILYFDRSGYAVWHKVLEEGTFRLPVASEISRVELTAVLEGVDIERYTVRKRYSIK